VYRQNEAEPAITDHLHIDYDHFFIFLSLLTIFVSDSPYYPS